MSEIATHILLQARLINKLKMVSRLSALSSNSQATEIKACLISKFVLSPKTTATHILKSGEQALLGYLLN